MHFGCFAVHACILFFMLWAR